MSPTRIFPFRELQTDRLDLRLVTDRDIDRLFVMRSDPSVMRHIQRPLARKTDDAREVLDRINEVMDTDTGIHWGIFRRGQPELIGTVGVWNYEAENRRAELGYMLAPACHRQGIMSEAIRAVLAYSRGLDGLHTLSARVDPDNTASRSLLEKLGFRQEGHLREAVYFEGEYFDTVLYGLVFSQ